MQRKYIIAVLLLLTLGVVSTLALGVLQSTVTETLTTDTTLQYDEASASFSEPDTTTTSTNQIDCTFTVTQSAEQKIDLIVKACSGAAGSGDIIASGGACVYSYTITYNDDHTQSVTDVAIADTNPITFSVTSLTSHGVITQLDVQFKNPGLVSDYNSMLLTVTDNTS